MHREYRQMCPACRRRGFGCFYSSPATQETPTVPDTPENPKEGAGSIKAPVDYLEPLVNPGVARAMKHGADKYGFRNYTVTPCKVRTYVAAVQRHLDAIKLGEDIDPESGLSHWDHIMAGAACYRGCELSGLAVDDRQAVSLPRSEAVHRDGNLAAKDSSVRIGSASCGSCHSLNGEHYCTGECVASVKVVEPTIVDCGGLPLTTQMRAAHPGARFTNFAKSA